MNRKKLAIILLIVILLLCSCTLVGGFVFWKLVLDNDPDPVVLPKLSDSMELFASEEEFDNYIADLGKKYGVDSDKMPGFGSVSLNAPMEDAALSGEETESITNVQEIGVDEGDIVKAYKDYLIILRRGRIFTVRLKDGSREELETVYKINAYPAGFTSGTWYDEMLIYENKIVVIGYSYELSATEIGIFAISDDGTVAHTNSYYLDSNDYYSSRNYASRLVENELIFYMPYYMFSYDYVGPLQKREVSFPQIRKWEEGNELSEPEDILSKTDIYKPVQDTYDPTLHTVVRCNLDSDTLDCSAKAILGPYSRTFYVSPQAIYVWVSEYDYYWYTEDSEEEEEQEKYSHMYMFYLEDTTARVLQAQGSPIDQFSFKEDEYGYINVLLQDNTSGGDAMWNSESGNGNLALMRVSLESFSDEPVPIPLTAYSQLPLNEEYSYSLQNRFVGDYLLYGEGSSWYYYDEGEERDGRVYVKNYTNDEETKQLSLSHGVDRIDIITDGAVVIGAREEDLQFSTIKLDRKVEVKDTYTIPNVAQGETRSHGFFYKPQEDGTGIIGLPIRTTGEPYYSLWEGSSKIAFLKVDTDKSISELGELVSRQEELDDNCAFSCVDWYGNSRPIFYDNRIFALMGYELVEGRYEQEEISEAERLNYYIE